MSSLSIEELATLLCPAVARQLIAWFFDGELVIVRELLASIDFAHGENDNVLLTVNIDHAGVAVGLAGVVNETGCIAVDGGINHLVVIDTKHVAANALSTSKKEKRKKREDKSMKNTGAVLF